jgi:zinc protease
LDRPARLEIPSKFATARLLMGFNTVKSSDPDYPILTVLVELLAQGKTGRLYKALVEGAEAALSVSAGNNGGRYPGWLDIQVELIPGKSRSTVEKLVLAELDKLRQEPPGERELRRAQRGILAATLFSRESVHGLADSIAQAVTTNDLEYLKNFLPRVLAVQPADVRRVTRKYLDPQERVVVWSVPEVSPGESPAGAGRSKTPRRKAESTSDTSFSLRRTKRVKLDNGLVLLLYEDHRLPLVAAEASVEDLSLLEPADKGGVAALTGLMLDEGTRQHTGEQIAESIEDVGGILAMSTSGGSVRVLAPDTRLGLGLLLECLMQPTFPKEAFARKKDQLLASIEDSLAQPDERARLAFRASAYGKHPLGRPTQGTIKSVTPLSPQDCAAFHRRAFVPNNVALAIVGDFDSQQVIDLVTRLTQDWKKTSLDLPAVPQVTRPAEFMQKIITMPQAAQLHFYMGHVGIRRANPDYYKLLVMDYVLGTGPGFTDRLSSRLRDREGLAYTVSATITTTADRQPSLFTCYIGTDPDNFRQVKREFLEEIRRIQAKTPTDQEVEDAKTYLLGNLALQFTTTGSIASQLLTIERNRLGFDYLEDYRKAVAAVTAQDVQAVARKYLDPDRLILVAAGAIDGDGRPLTRAPAPKR